MLARRFTIVCLLTALFAMGLSILVTEAGNTRRHWPADKVVACSFEQGVTCQTRHRARMLP